MSKSRKTTKGVTQALTVAEDPGDGGGSRLDREIKDAAAKYKNDEGALIQILLDVQKAKGYLSREWLFGLSEELGIPLARTYKAATFYKAFSLEPRGRHMVQICTGTACHVRGAPVLVNRVSSVLGIRPGKTTKDGQFSLETVNCLGCCALGPVMAIDDKYLSNPSAEELDAAFSSYR
jgi:NADH-quinone oxidoreductase subunit E